jgi:hypothetical protein
LAPCLAEMSRGPVLDFRPGTNQTTPSSFPRAGAFPDSTAETAAAT